MELVHDSDARCAGDLKSMTDLGVAYLKGLLGLSKSNAQVSRVMCRNVLKASRVMCTYGALVSGQALPLLRQAAELGLGEAMYHLADFVEDKDRKLDLYEQGAQAGHPVCACCINQPSACG